MISLTTFYDEHIDRPKPTEPKKKHLSIELLSPHEGVGTKKQLLLVQRLFSIVTKGFCSFSLICRKFFELYIPGWGISIFTHRNNKKIHKRIGYAKSLLQSSNKNCFLAVSFRLKVKYWIQLGSEWKILV